MREQRFFFLRAFGSKRFLFCIIFTHTVPDRYHQVNRIGCGIFFFRIHIQQTHEWKRHWLRMRWIPKNRSFRFDLCVASWFEFEAHQFGQNCTCTRSIRMTHLRYLVPWCGVYCLRSSFAKFRFQRKQKFMILECFSSVAHRLESPNKEWFADRFVGHQFISWNRMNSPSKRDRKELYIGMGRAVVCDWIAYKTLQHRE